MVTMGYHKYIFQYLTLSSTQFDSSLWCNVIGWGSNKTRRRRTGLKMVPCQPMSVSSREGGVLMTNFQLLMLSPNLLKTKFPNVEWLMLSPNLKTKFLYVLWGGGGGDKLPTFNPESKSAKILYSLCWKVLLKKFYDKKCAIPSCRGRLQMVPVHYVCAGP